MFETACLYDLNLYFKVITLIFLSFLLFVNNMKGGLNALFFGGLNKGQTSSDKVEITMLSYPNIFILVISSSVFALFMNVLGYSFFDIGVYTFFLDSLILLLLLFLKLLMVYMSSLVLDENNLFKVFDREILSYLSIMSLVTLVLVFVALNYNLGSIYSLLVIVVFVEILWYVRLSYKLLQSTTFNFLYFFSYLCSLEIIPTLAVAIYIGVI